MADLGETLKTSILIKLNSMTIALTLLAIIIIIVVGLQSKGNGLSIIQGTGDFGKFERRGGEKILHNATIVLIVAFVGLSLVSYFIS